MTTPRGERRSFLKRAATAMAAAPFSTLPGRFAAQAPSHPASRPPAHPLPPVASAAKMDVHLNARDLGAKGDGVTRDTVALQQALDRVNLLGGGELLVPAGDYLTGPLVLRSGTTLRLEEGASLLGSPEIADYPLTQVRWEGRWIKGYGALLSAWGAENVTITGKGKIVASPAIRGRYVNADGSPIARPSPGTPPRPTGTPMGVARQNILRHPALMEFTRCKNLLVENVFTQGNDMWSTHPVYCENVTFRNVAIHSGADGIDVDSCRHVVIEGCDFQTRDDCISLKSGRGMEGNTIGIPCEDISITNCTFVDATFACIGIGSETSAGVRNVRIEHCKCLGARSHAIYIKTRPGRGAFLENIFVDDFEASHTGQGFLRINTLSSGLQDPYPVPGEAGIPTVRNFRFTNIRVQEVPVLVQADEIHPDKPLDGLTLANISGTCAKGISLANVRNADLKDIRVTGYTGPLLSTYATTGRGLSGAAPLEAPKVPAPIAPPAEAFVLK